MYVESAKCATQAIKALKGPPIEHTKLTATLVLLANVVV